MALHNKTFVVKRSLNYAKLDKLHYFEVTYYKVGQFLLQTWANITKWDIFIIRNRVASHYYKVGQYYKVVKLYKVGN